MIGFPFLNTLILFYTDAKSAVNAGQKTEFVHYFDIILFNSTNVYYIVT